MNRPCNFGIDPRLRILEAPGRRLRGHNCGSQVYAQREFGEGHDEFVLRRQKAPKVGTEAKRRVCRLYRSKYGNGHRLYNCPSNRKASNGKWNLIALNRGDWACV